MNDSNNDRTSGASRRTSPPRAREPGDIITTVAHQHLPTTQMSPDDHRAHEPGAGPGASVIVPPEGATTRPRLITPTAVAVSTPLALLLFGFTFLAVRYDLFEYGPTLSEAFIPRECDSDDGPGCLFAVSACYRTELIRHATLALGVCWVAAAAWHGLALAVYFRYARRPAVHLRNFGVAVGIAALLDLFGIAIVLSLMYEAECYADADSLLTPSHHTTTTNSDGIVVSSTAHPESLNSLGYSFGHCFRVQCMDAAIMVVLLTGTVYFHATRKPEVVGESIDEHDVLAMSERPANEIITGAAPFGGAVRDTDHHHHPQNDDVDVPRAEAWR